MDNPTDGSSGKLGHGFVSAGGLNKIDIGSGDRTGPTYMDTKSNLEYEPELMDLLEEI